jgi:cephalosporin hydroxylase
VQESDRRLVIKALKYRLIKAGLDLYNSAHKLMRPCPEPGASYPELKEIVDRAVRTPSDISDHLVTIFSETVASRPSLIVELGVRGGESRFALERAAKRSGSFLVSVDVDDSSAVCGQSPRWFFAQSDDIQFAAVFKDWCLKRAMEPSIGVLFIDTSHLYEHTVQEIKAWFPYLSLRCKVIFHDTNIRKVYRRLDGTLGTAWDNKRGVIQAIEDHVGAKFNERLDFVTTVNEWIIRHWAHCNGLTVMER